MLTARQHAASLRRVAREIRVSAGNICKGFPRDATARKLMKAIAGAHENEARVIVANEGRL